MGGRVKSSHPYFQATGKWPPPGYGGHSGSDGSAEASAAQEPRDAELDGEAGSYGGQTVPEGAEQVTSDGAAADRVHPGAEAARTGDSSVVPSSIVQAPAASGEEERESGQPPDAALEQLDEQKFAETLLQRAVRMFLRPGEEPIRSCTRRLANEVTNGLVVAVRAVLRALYRDCRADVCRSPERPDLQLSQEEAMGYLTADALGRPLLAALDARGPGKRIDSRAVAVEKQLAALPKAATEAARKEAAKSGESFDRATFAAQHEADARGALLAKTYDPKLPPTTVGKRKRPAEQAAAATEEPEDAVTRHRRRLEELRAMRPQLQQEAKAAAAALDVFQAALPADAERVERAQRRRDSLGVRPSWAKASELIKEPDFGDEIAEWEAEEARWGAAVDDKLQQLEAPYEQADAAVEAAKAEQAAGKARERELLDVSDDANMKLVEAEYDLEYYENWERWAGALTNALTREQQLVTENERLRARLAELEPVAAG